MSLEIDNLSKNQIKIRDEIESLLSSLPNLALDEVPVGKDEKMNKEIKNLEKLRNFLLRQIGIMG